MKYLYLTTLVLLLILSCSKDDESKTPCSSSIFLLIDCEKIETEISYSVTEKEYRQITDSQSNPGNICERFITIKDINGKSHSGYYRGGITTCK
jgi:hypothetical protein